MTLFKKIAFLFLISLGPVQEVAAQACFPNQVITSAFATGGTSPYRNDVLWLTWGSQLSNVNQYPYGRNGQNLSVGSKSRASIHLGGNSYLCIEVEITNVVGGSIDSYAPGNYVGDSMDKLYNIGGVNSANKLVCGIINRFDKGNSTITFKAKAKINGQPIRLSGLAIADAESLSEEGEYIKATAVGSWNVVDIRKNISSTNYLIGKRSGSDSKQTIEFAKGNNANTGAVAFLEFGSTAYNSTDDLSVTFTAELKGQGMTALALGLLTPNADLGDAPESYGSPVHLIQNLKVNGDNISVTTNSTTNINSSNYSPGSLSLNPGKFLGSTAPDSDYSPKYSKDALGDDTSGNGGTNEEDAWPQKYKRFSYKVNYTPGNQINTNIPFKNGVVGDYISGWIDFNLDGEFEESERQSKRITRENINNGYVNLIWTVPETRVVKSTYVRLRYFDSKEDFTSSNNSVNFGEVEDHKMIILIPKSTNIMLQNKKK